MCTLKYVHQCGNQSCPENTRRQLLSTSRYSPSGGGSRNDEDAQRIPCSPTVDDARTTTHPEVLELTENRSERPHESQGNMAVNFISRLNDGEPYALMFAGQATPWREHLADLGDDGRLRHVIDVAITASDELLAPVAAPLAAAGAARLTWDSLVTESGPAISVPGITAVQCALMHALARAGLDLVRAEPVAILGHSQGVLGAEIARRWGEPEAIAQVFAVARLIGAAAERQSRIVGIGRGERSPMLAVRDMSRRDLERILADANTGATLAIINSPRRFIVSGTPTDLERVEIAIDTARAADRAELSAKIRGGMPMSPICEFLEVEAPFHHLLLEPAVDQVLAWANECGLEVNDLAADVLVNPVDWSEQIADARRQGAQWFLDLGPGPTVGRISVDVLEGTGVGVVPAGRLDLIDRLAAPGPEPERTSDWSHYTPRLLELSSGTVVDTAFSRLTGNSPILLAGMTPTTVEPEIVAAAANSGFWAELAGGGQVTAEVFANHLAGLKSLLEPGRTAKFNAMFMDRYLWDLQFGAERLVSKARESGAPLDGVVISAGIPEVDEATALIADLQAQGFAHIAFKPGTVAQIRSCLAIARTVEIPVILHVEDGHAGGHHSWENLDDLLQATYAEIRHTSNVVLCVGGGIGTPDRAAEYIWGTWSEKYGLARMPVDGVLIATAAMTAKEAKTTRSVKELLVATPGVQDADGGWVSQGTARGGVTSGLSHLRADMHELDNDAAACARIIAEVESKPEQLRTRRAEIIEALNKTAKPYFGELAEMTYAAVLRRFADLSHPWADPSWLQRYHELIQRFEARLAPVDHGPVVTSFPTIDDVEKAAEAADAFILTHPSAQTDTLTAQDASWFVALCRKYPKPMGFVPAIDDDLLRWWGLDSLWQSHDDRYPASAVRIIPGPVSVGGITTIDEPIADILIRFEDACRDRLVVAGAPRHRAFARLNAAQDAAEFIRTVPFISWTGHLMDNPAHHLDPSAYRLEVDGQQAILTVHLDTYWDESRSSVHAVRELTIPLLVPESVSTGGVPVVDVERLPDSMFALLAGVAGVGNTAVTGDEITHLPHITPSARSEFGEAHHGFSVPGTLGPDHTGVTAKALDLDTPTAVPDALLGPCWPAIYAALGSARVDDFPVIEGLLNAVHLDHTLRLERPMADLGVDRIDVVSWAESITESSSGRIVQVDVELSTDGERVATIVERFAIRGRAFGTGTPAEPPVAGGTSATIIRGPRSTLLSTRVSAPTDMTPFAWVSGDFNPIHTSVNAARVAGLKEPLVHGMWLSAVAQHAASTATGTGGRLPLTGWTYRMFGLVDLGAEIDITVERTGRLPGGGLALEVSCRIGDELVSRATATTAAPATAYVYPGQGIQAKGMGLAERASSAAASQVWDRADTHSRMVLGFSIIALVRDNPKEITARGTTYRHPEGVLHLTQFTQVALATLAFAQTARLREAEVLVGEAYFAGHSLGEYTALSAYAEVIELETVLEIVFHRGQTMHHLVPRDSQGRSNYQLGALRPNQLGVDASQIDVYIASVAEASGEFLEIVNYNLAGQQYAIAGTIAGLAALEADANERAAKAGGKGAFLRVPGVDVPFHSRVLRDGVPEFREHLLALLPERINHERLIGHYIPNLVAIPFDLTRDFVNAILEVVPSAPLEQVLADWETRVQDRAGLARLLLVELLCWQFASPVRWIETQDALFSPDGSGIDEFVEIGLGASPTLANLATRTLALPRYATADILVRNVQRDEKLVHHEDVRIVDEPDSETLTVQESTPVISVPEPVVAIEVPAPTSSINIGVEAPPDLPFTAADAVKALLAHGNKLRPDQIGDADTTGTLTNGVSSRLNQLLMDLSAELGLASIEGAAEADVATLSATVDQASHNYKPFGPVLGDAIKDRVRKLFGAASQKQAAIAERLASTWQLGDGWIAHTTVMVLLGSRPGASTRGGDLATLPTDVQHVADVVALIDEAVTQVGAAHGIPVAIPQAATTGGAIVDSAALDTLADRVTGADGILAASARHVLAALDLDQPEIADFDHGEEEETAVVLAAVRAELGVNWSSTVAPVFDERKAILLDDRWASAREDLARLGTGESLPETVSFIGAGSAVADQASWWAAHSTGALAKRFDAIAKEALSDNVLEFTGQIAVVTGMAPNSIAGALVADLLAGGATVVATASTITPERLNYAKSLYRHNATGQAALWLVPANLVSYRDVDALVSWIGSEQSETVGAEVNVIKPMLVPDLYFPFAAPPVQGTLEDAGAAAETQARLLLWSVERSMTALGRIGADTRVDHRLHVVLPGSPNKGTFGGDGAYGEVKAAFDAIVNKWDNEPWSGHITLAHPQIGWVAGTSLMGGNDPLVAAATEAGIRVWSPADISKEILKLATVTARQTARTAPLDADLTGGLREVSLSALPTAPPLAPAPSIAEELPRIQALPSPVRAEQPSMDSWPSVDRSLDEMVVIVGLGEVGPWGSGRTRFEAEYGIQYDGTVDLTAAGVLELAWMTGLLTWRDTPVAGWYDSDGTVVDESEIFDRFHDEVVARSGVRSFVDDMAIDELTSLEQVDMFLDRDVTFGVEDEAAARSYVESDPNFTTAWQDHGEWKITRVKGARARVPRKATLARLVGGQFPTHFDPTRWGIPAAMVESIDRIAVWNLVATVDAYVSAGFTPAEILQAVHPSDVAMTQGTGFGGMTSMRKLFVDRFLAEDIPTDILQETLPNVVAAHTMQSYIGGYGSMIHPVGACATAAVSVEEGVDKIACRKADFVVTGAIDDIAVESITGFANMNATANSQVMVGKGISERFYSRANDRRRAGFVESQGGGAILLTRGSVARKLGLPVQAVVGFVQSYADGVHTSIPAPGIGAVAAGRGGPDSRLATNLAALGVEVDDIAVVSKHDTSTNANDPNESELHTRLAAALGRDQGNPLFVVSQKTLTGHAKGGAAVFQIAGLADIFRTCRIPANRALDCVDPELATSPGLVWLREPLTLPKPVKASLMTSLGFGHVSALVALVHPAAFEQAIIQELGVASADQWRQRAISRLRSGARLREAGMLGHTPLFTPVSDRRFAKDAANAREVETQMLLDPEARLAVSGIFE